MLQSLHNKNIQKKKQKHVTFPPPCVNPESRGLVDSEFESGQQN